MLQVCKELTSRWVNWDEKDAGAFGANDLKDFSSGQIQEFLSLLLLEEPLRFVGQIFILEAIINSCEFLNFSIKKLQTMESVYGLNAVQNAEVRFRWIRLGLRGHWDDAVDRAVRMVTDQGRMKFLRPIYR